MGTSSIMIFKLKYKDEPVVDYGKEGFPGGETGMSKDLEVRKNWHEQRGEEEHSAFKGLQVGQEHRERWRSKQGPDQKNLQVMLGTLSTVLRDT